MARGGRQECYGTHRIYSPPLCGFSVLLRSSLPGPPGSAYRIRKCLLLFPLLNLFLGLLHLPQSVDFLGFTRVSTFKAFLFLLNRPDLAVVIGLPFIIESLIVRRVVSSPGTGRELVISGIGIIGCGLWRSVLIDFGSRGYAQRVWTSRGSSSGGRRLRGVYSRDVWY
ncbi:hypothetical protein EDB86DRAFT_1747618 [Lactarius hatsudake]|nr:hypothetical protein EDB86DRAFT_1747618 [Lactarius hatsudake]